MKSLSVLNGRNPRAGHNIRVPCRDLTDAEIGTAAQACRAMAYQEGERAKTLEGTSMREPIENASKRYAALAEKLEAARKR